MFQRFRRFLNPISPPKIIKLPCGDLKPEFADFTPTTNINFPLLVHPSISNNLCRISTLLNPTPFFAPIPQPDIKLLFEPLSRPQITPIPLTLPAPQIHHVPVYIEKRGERGKVYETIYTDKTKPTQTQKYVFCKHGTLLYRCPDCSTARPSSAPAKRIDEFDLLPPYLNPPLQDTLKLSSMWLDKIKPFDYQIQGIIFLAKSPSALLGDEMGLGKTIQAIVALWAIFARGEVFKGLIVCRLALLSNWERELQTWGPVFVFQRVHGAKNEREQMWRTPASIYITTYDTLREDIERIALLKTKFQHGAIILDEVQDIKNPNIKKTRAIHQIQAKYKWGLSGTPIENKVEDVVSIFNYLKPDLFYRQPNVSDLEVKEHIKRYFLRRRIKDVQLELPPLINHVVPLDLNPQQQQAYDHAYKTGRNELKRPNTTPIHIFKLINILKQICNYDNISQDSCKLDYIRGELETIIANGEKALIFSQYPIKTFEVIKPYLVSFAPEIYDGRSTNKEREQIYDQFQNQTSPKVLLMSTKIAVGLNLQRANHAFHFDHLWNPAAQNQATSRIYRIGQAQTVFVHNIFTKNTIEERIQQILHQKQTLFDTIIDDLSAEYEKGKFTEAELFDLFDLPPPRK